jgi:AcrR family transcriptional regulator
MKSQRRGRPPKPSAPVPRPPSRATAVPTFDVVVTAAEQVLAGHGIDALTTNRVAELAGVSIGTLYRYFPNKNAIVAALFERYLMLFDEIAKAAIDTSSRLDEAAFKLGIGVATRFEAQPTIFRELWRLRTAAGAHDRIAFYQAKIIEYVRGLLRRAGITDDARVDALAFMFVHAGDGIANGVANAVGQVDPHLIARMFVEMVTAFTRTLPELSRGDAPKPS